VSRTGPPRQRSRGILVTALAAALAFTGCQRPHAQPGLNVVLIVIDTLRRDHVGAYGYERPITPTLDALAARGVALDGIAPTSWTKPSTASILTGLHPLRHGATRRIDPLPPSVPTLAERLNAFGFHSVGVSANRFVSRDFGFERGFDTFAFEDVRPDGSLPEAMTVVSRFERDNGALREPFFAYLHLVDPHAPYAPRQTWDGKPRRPDQPIVTMAALDATHFGRRPPALLALARDLYDGEIRDADDGVSAVLDDLRRRGLLERTLVVVASDHGEEFEEHGRMSHGQQLHRESVDVPLIFSGPGVTPRGHVPIRVSLMDIVPTILALAGAPPLRDSDGLDLRPLLVGSEIAPALAERSFLLHLDMSDGASLGWMEKRYKMLLGQRPYHKELFDIGRDPAEQASLWDDALEPGPAEVARGMADRLAETYNTLSDEAPARVIRPLRLDEEQGLQAMGYVGSTASTAATIPAVIRAADLEPGGALGWEPTTPILCIEPETEDGASRTLGGWHAIEANGRWMAASASLFMTPGRSGPARLRLSGINHRPDTPRLRAAYDGRTVFDGPVPPGRFDVLSEELATSEAPRRVKLDVTPTYVASPNGDGDKRPLGLFFQQICVVPSAK
jgi:arylsulfatase A-like enzyme